MALLAWVACTSSAPAIPGTENLTHQISGIMNDHRIPGVGIAMVRRDAQPWVTALGYADVTTSRPATTRTIFRLGSTSKIFVGLAALKLQEQGRLSLADKLSSLAPDIPFVNEWEESNPIRLVHLLEHTSGWDDLSFRNFAVAPDLEGPTREYAPLWADSRRTKWKPGTIYSYSNAGIAAAAIALERAAGEPLEDFVQREFFGPLGMHSTSYFEPRDDLKATRFYRADGRTPVPYWRMITRPAGALNASAEDMVPLLQLFLQRGVSGGHHLLAASSIERMETTTTTDAARAGITVGYGVTLYAIPSRGFQYFGHYGAVIGGACVFEYDPVHGFGYVVFTNSARFSGALKIAAAMREFLEQGKSPAFKVPAAVPPNLQPADVDGWYEPMSTRFSRFEFLAGTAGLVRFRINNGFLERVSIFGRTQRYVVTADRVFRGEEDSFQSVLVMPEADGVRVQVAGPFGETFVRVATMKALGPILWLGLLLGAVAAQIVFIFLSIIRGRRAFAASIKLHGVPLLAVATALALALTAAAATSVGLEMVWRLGRASPWSVSIFGLSVVLPIISILAVLAALRMGNQRGLLPLERAVAILTGCLMMALVIFIGYHRMIGIRTWV